MLRRGFHVMAIDPEPNATKALKNLDVQSSKLDIQTCRMEHAQLPANIDFVHASYSLPFCNPTNFTGFWARLIKNMPIGSLLCGQLFGVNDSWADNPDITFHTRQQAEQWLKDFELIEFDEEDKDGKTALGVLKHWHVFHFIACKRS